MVISKGSFVSGFTLTVDIRVKPKVEVIGSTKQPIDVVLPNDTTPYEQSDIQSKEFFNYELVKKKVQISGVELQAAKNKLQ